MKSNKGISMITLVITIVSMLILLGIAYRIGSRYISKSKEEERTALVSILSTTVERRQNDKYVGLGDEDIYYIGYHVSSGDFERLYPKFENKSNIYDPGFWYVIDAEKAEDLGIVNADKYLVEDVKKDANKNDDKYVAIVDYFTGNVELIKRVEVEDDVLGDITEGTDETGCPHTEITIATCIEPAVCNNCGKVIHQALGHNYPINTPSCTEDKKCTRCGFILEKALGHEYLEELSFNDRGHFHKCRRYDDCGSVGGFEEHKKKYTALDTDPWEWIHEVKCEKCLWVDEDEACTVKIKSKDVKVHIEYCVDCFKQREQEHDDLKYRYIDKTEHMVYCDTCDSDLYKEEHIDIEEPYGICDKCDGIMDISKPPRVEVLTVENITPGESGEYWARKGDTIKITLQTNLVLSGAPTVKLQDIEIKKEDMKQNGLTFTITIDTFNYPFIDGLMGIEVINMRSMWSVEGEPVYATTDGKYVTYDATKPIYIYVPED